MIRISCWSKMGVPTSISKFYKFTSVTLFANRTATLLGTEFLDISVEHPHS